MATHTAAQSAFSHARVNIVVFTTLDQMYRNMFKQEI